MSSKLLEEAIVDAEALKEAALLSAQAAILEKYAPDVRKAIQLILEQEVSPLGDSDKDDPLAGLESDSLGGGLDGGNGGLGDAGGADLAMPPPEEGPDTTNAINKVPLAATESEKLCACPDEDEEIEINFDELEKQMASTVADDNIPDGMPQSDTVGLSQDNDDALGLKEEIEIDEDLIRGLFENEDDQLEEEVQEEGEECSDEVVSESKKPLKNTTVKVQSKLNEKKDFSKNTTLIKENNELIKVRRELLEENKKIKKAVNQLTQRLEETNLSNAKLVFTNQALTSNSLNERQKTKIVEAISKAESVEEANLIFNTLQQTVGSVSKKPDPKSLNEAVGNKGTLKFTQREKPVGNPVYNRMQEMAGIKKK